jgi:hypothetical protein
MSDALKQAGTAEELMGSVKEMNPLVENLVLLTRQSADMIGRMQEFITAFRREFPRDRQFSVGKKLDLATQATDDLVTLTDRVLGVRPEAVDSSIVRARKEMDGVIWTLVLAVLAAGGGLAAIWWSGYYLAKKAYLRKSLSLAEQARKGPPSDQARKSA